MCLDKLKDVVDAYYVGDPLLAENQLSCSMKVTDILRDHYNVKSLRSVVYRCASCHTWVWRTPYILSELGEWRCEKCGCSSVILNEGRKYGPKSKEWENFLRIVWEYPIFQDWVYVEFDPPMSDEILDFLIENVP